MKVKPSSSEQYELDFTMGTKLKQAGMAKVAGHNDGWNEEVRLEFVRWLREKEVGFRFKGEDFRFHVLNNTDIGHPRHPNAWGAFFGHLDNKGPVKMLEITAISVSPRSHAGRSMLWEKVNEQ